MGKIEVDNNFLLFKGTKGNIAPQTIQVRNTGQGKLKFRLISDCDWIKIKPKKGVSRGEWKKCVVSINSSSLENGNYTGTIEVLSPGAFNSPQIINVRLEVD